MTFGSGSLTTVESRDEDNLVPVLQLVLELTLQLPVGVVDEDKYSRSAGGQLQTSTLTHTPSPSINISSRSLTRLSFIQEMRKRTSAGRPSGAVLGI